MIDIRRNLRPIDSFRDVQWLVDRPRGEGLVVSCYADTSVTSGFKSLWREHFKNEVKRIEESLTGDADALAMFQENIAAIETVLSRRHPGVSGNAVFAAVQRGFIEGFALTTPLPSRLVVDEEPYLLPLLELLHRQRRYLVVHTNTHRGRLYTSVPGSARLIAEINENVPKRQRASGERWGKQQATIARHREDLIRHYFKDLAGEIERAWPDERYDGIVLLGPHEVLEELRTHLPDHLARRIVREAAHAWAGRQVRLEAKIEGIHAEAVHEHDRRVLDEVKRRLLEHHQIATGPQEVINALRNSQVGFPGSVVMEPDRGEVASRCTGCTSLFAHAVDECPFCQARCERTNLWQAIALLAARHGIPVHVVEAGQGLEKHGGVAALLAREEPWASRAEIAAAVPAGGA